MKKMTSKQVAADLTATCHAITEVNRRESGYKIKAYFPRFTPPKDWKKSESWMDFGSCEDLQDAVATVKLLNKYWEAEYKEPAEFMAQTRDGETLAGDK